MEYLKHGHKICLTIPECEAFYKEASIKLMFEVMKGESVTLQDLMNDRKKTLDIVYKAVAEGLKSKEKVEIFAAVYSVAEFYQGEIKVCFDLKSSVDKNSVNINSLQDLIDSCEENTLNDFSIISSNSLRTFQLKRYREALQTNTLFEFIKKVLLKYGNDLGETNLLIVLQSEDKNLDGLDFKKLYNLILSLGIKARGHILISYNEENKVSVLNTVFPQLGTTRKDIDWQSDLLEG